MNIPQPLLVANTPAEGYTISIQAGEGGLAGLRLLGQSGPAFTAELSTDGLTFVALTYPHTLAAGETLRLTRADSGPQLSVINAVFSVQQSTGLVLNRDGDGYLTADGLTRDADGYLTTDQPLARDGDGYLTNGG